MAKFKLDLSQFQRDIEAESRKKAQEQIKKLSQRELMTIGNSAIEEMKKAIAKGLSPIKGAGRFPAYLWAGKKSLARKSGAKKRKELNREFQNKYPYSVKNKFPDKKERPVNLKLSGEFLKNLKSMVEGRDLFIGFEEGSTWADYESGHREGVHEQPKRPIIPQEDEQFSDSILRRLVKTVQSVFDKKK